MADYNLPPVGVSITVPFVGYVASVKNGLVTLQLRNGDILQVREPAWTFAEPDWLPARFGDLIESCDEGNPRYLFIGAGQWVNSQNGSVGSLTDEAISRCRLLSRNA